MGILVNIIFLFIYFDLFSYNFLRRPFPSIGRKFKWGGVWNFFTFGYLKQRPDFLVGRMLSVFIDFPDSFFRFFSSSCACVRFCYVFFSFVYSLVFSFVLYRFLCYIFSLRFVFAFFVLFLVVLLFSFGPD